MKTEQMTRNALVVVVILGICGSVSSGWSTPVPVSEVNTEYADHTPFLSFDGLSLYFARRDTGTFYYSRIFEATRSVPYGPFTSVSEVLRSSNKHVFSPWVSPDNLRMYYFAQTETPMLWQLKVSQRASDNDPWPSGSDITELNMLGKPSSPQLTADELNIFFYSDTISIPGGVGGYDTWMATRTDVNSPFSGVRNLSEINTVASDIVSSVSPDGLTLYFSSSRNNGLHKLFRATRVSLIQPFGNIEHLSFFDTPGGHSVDSCISSDGTALYFVRTPTGEPSDIYVSYSQPGPVAHWKLDEGSGVIAYDSAGTNDGTIYGAAWTTGLIDGALDFDGVDDYVEVPDDTTLDLDQEATLSAWINTRSLSVSQGIVGRWNYAGTPDKESITLEARGDYDNTFMFGISNDGTDTTTTLLFSNLQYSQNTWYHITGTYDGATMRLYVNGESDNYVSKTGNIFISDTNWYIGAFNYAGVSYFNGLIDDVRIYDRALSASEIMELYGPYSGPVAHWKFDEGSGAVAYDSAGTNDGTIYGAGWTTGIIGGALDFDGVDDYVDVPDDDSLTPSSQITISYWIYDRGSLSGQDTYGVHKYGGCAGEPYSPSPLIAYELAINPSTNRAGLIIYLPPGSGAESVVSNAAISLNQWHHITGTFDRGDAAIYIDGQLDNSTMMSVSGILNDAHSLMFGARWSYCGVPDRLVGALNGKIDDVQIYDRALSAVEIEELYNSAPPPPVGETYHVDGANGDNTNDGLSRGTAFATIQRGINAAEDYDAVLVWPGVYNEEIGFWGDAITVKSAADAAIVETNYGYAFSFFSAEGPDTVLSNFIIRNSQYGIYLINGASPTLSNLTIVNNDFGISAFNGSDPDISSCILWGNYYGDLFRDPVPLEAKYSWIQEEEANEPNMPPAGLISHWKLDEGAGLIVYDSAGNNDGVTFGATWTTGLFGNALDFDGTDDYILIGDDEDFYFGYDVDFSICAWIKTTTKRMEIVSKSAIGHSPYTGYNLYIKENTGEGVFRLKDTADRAIVSTTSIVTDGNWHFLAGVADRDGNLYIYHNGVVEDSDSLTSIDNIDTNISLSIGRSMDYGGYYFDGLIDDVSIFNRALSSEEIEQIYEPLVNPLFADAAGGDYHLKSERGRYWPAHDVWVLDDVTSPCIDAGDPNVNPSNEPMPSGGRINMGAYGNTAYASMSEWPIKGDTNNDGRFNFMDIAILLDEWLEELPWAE